MRSLLLAVGLNIALIVNAVAVQDVCSIVPYTTLKAEQCPPIHSNAGAHQTQLLDPDTFDALFLKDTTLPKIYNERRTELADASKPSRSIAQSDHKTESGETQSTATSLTKNQNTHIPNSPPPQESKSGKLLSFEEWKRQVVQQEGDDPSKRRKVPPVKKSRSSQRQQIDSIDGAFGDDVGSMFDNSEDTPLQPVPLPGAYSGRRQHHVDEQTHSDFVDKELVPPPITNQKSSPTAELAHRKPIKKDKESINPLKKLKELYNYASIDCAATVLQANKDAKNPQSILYESKDQYMLNKCSSDKFVIIDLCESILIDKFVLANFEFFSSTFKDFRVYVADRYPPKEWRLLGQWQARNTRDLQIFKVETGLDWYQYIKIEFLSHYGNEYYCPLSLLRVHGNPMMEYWTLYEKPKITGEDEEDDMLKGISPDPVVDEAEFLWPAFSSVDIDTKLSTPNIPTVEDMLIAEREAKSVKLENLGEQVQSITEPFQTPDSQSGEAHTDAKPVDEQPVKVETVNSETSDRDEEFEPSTSVGNSSFSADSDFPSSSASVDVTEISSTDEVVLDSHTEQSNATSLAADNTTTSSTLESGHVSEQIVQDSKSTEPEVTTPTAGTTAPIPSTEPAATQTASNSQIKSPFGYGQGANMESIYKTIMTRILNLEQNATLSQRYLDEQNRMLNEVFETMEDRHREQLLQLVGQLNSTAILRIDTMKRRYERLFRMTARELEMTKNETAKELQELTSKLHIMADQVVFEKRLSLIQLILLISLFLFTAANKGTLSALSPIVAAQAEERQRRQSLSQGSHQPLSPAIEKIEDAPDSPDSSGSPASPQFSSIPSTSKSIDSPIKPQSNMSSLSEAKRELQATKSSVDHLNLKPKRQSTAELLSRTAEYDPLHQEHWDEKENEGRRRDSKKSKEDDDERVWDDNAHDRNDESQSRYEHNDAEYLHSRDNLQPRNEDLLLPKLEVESPMLYDSPAALSDAWPSPSSQTPEHSHTPHDHLNGDLRLSRASSFVDRLDLAYIDSPKVAKTNDHWWNDSDKNSIDRASYHEQQIQENVEHFSPSDHETYLAPEQRLFDQSTGSENSEDESQSVPQLDGR